MPPPPQKQLVAALWGYLIPAAPVMAHVPLQLGAVGEGVAAV